MVTPLVISICLNNCIGVVTPTYISNGVGTFSSRMGSSASQKPVLYGMEQIGSVDRCFEHSDLQNEKWRELDQALAEIFENLSRSEELLTRV